MSFQRLRLFQHQGVNSVHLTNSDSNATSKILFDVCYHPSPELRIQNSCSPVFLLDSCLISLDWESFALRKKTEKLRVENPAFPHHVTWYHLLQHRAYPFLVPSPKETALFCSLQSVFCCCFSDSASLLHYTHRVQPDFYAGLHVLFQFFLCVLLIY